MGIHLPGLAVLLLRGVDAPLAHGLVAADVRGGESTLYDDAYRQ
jgi:hypothetical protein